MTKLTYTEALRYLCTHSSLNDKEDLRQEAADVIVDAVWYIAKETGDGKGEMHDWIMEGDFSPADLNRLEAFSPEALAAEWDTYQRNAQTARETYE